MSHDNHSHFIVPVKYYAGTFAALLVLTVITVWVAQYDFGSLNLFIAMTVATVKASLVAGIFMALKWDKGFNRIILIGTLLFLGIFILFTVADVFTRGDTDPREKRNHTIHSPVKPLSSTSEHSKAAPHH